MTEIRRTEEEKLAVARLADRARKGEFPKPDKTTPITAADMLEAMGGTRERSPRHRGGSVESVTSSLEEISAPRE